VFSENRNLIWTLCRLFRSQSASPPAAPPRLDIWDLSQPNFETLKRTMESNPIRYRKVNGSELWLLDIPDKSPYQVALPLATSVLQIIRHQCSPYTATVLTYILSRGMQVFTFKVAPHLPPVSSQPIVVSPLPITDGLGHRAADY